MMWGGGRSLFIDHMMHVVGALQHQRALTCASGHPLAVAGFAASVATWDEHRTRTRFPRAASYPSELSKLHRANR
jgi:hypothetical protein